MNIPKKGFDACPGDPKDPSKLPSIQMEQQRADGKEEKEISWTSRVVDKDNADSNEDEMPSEAEVRLGDEDIPFKKKSCYCKINTVPSLQIQEF